MGGLYDSQPGVRRASAEALELYGSMAKQAAPSLLQTRKDSDKSVREAAIRALIRIDPEAAAKAAVQ